jgi:acyltransferase
MAMKFQPERRSPDATASATPIAPPPLARVPWLDVAKAYGILLVVYAHFIERLAEENYRAAFLQFKFIYAFHIPLFFVLAGYVHRDHGEDPRTFLKSRAATRLIPVLFFNLLSLAVFLIVSPPTSKADLKLVILSVLSFARGYPSYNWLMWFLVCLFTVEILHFFVGKHATTTLRLIALAVGSYLIGWVLLWQSPLVSSITGIARNFWFLHEALIAYPFFLAGLLAKRLRIFDRPSLAGRLLIFLALLGLTCATFNLNVGPFVWKKAVVVMAESSHGSLWLFPVTALAGALMIGMLARVTPPARWLLFIGANTIPLMGLDAIFHDYINLLLAQRLSGLMPDTQWAVLLAGILVTAATVTICAPGMYLLSRYLPQLMGRPKVKGPLLKNLI